MLTPFVLGFLAYQAGLGIMDSPYRYCTDSDCDWIEGFMWEM